MQVVTVEVGFQDDAGRLRSDVGTAEVDFGQRQMQAAASGLEIPVGSQGDTADFQAGGGVRGG
jgi:hypothetical protein